MTARAFADTNIVIYAEGSDDGKAQRATEVLESGPVISAQVINEAVSALTRKYGFTLPEAHELALSLLDLCEVVPVTADTIREAVRLAARYQIPGLLRGGRDHRRGHYLGPNIAAVALANKNARIVWALPRHGREFQLGYKPARIQAAAAGSH